VLKLQDSESMVEERWPWSHCPPAWRYSYRSCCLTFAMSNPDNAGFAILLLCPWINCTQLKTNSRLFWGLQIPFYLVSLSGFRWRLFI